VRITHDDARDIIALAKEWGMQRGLFNIRGTFRGGYDEYHPDIWPPESALGSLDQLKRITQQPSPFITALHDNYQDIYPRCTSFPEGVVQDRNGHLMQGGHWHGGQSFIICPTRQIEYARRNWEKVRTLDPGGYFIDTAACVQFYQCFHPHHPMSRTQDVEAKLQLMSFFKEQGVVLGSENAADFGLYHLDFLENRHERIAGESIPLWPLVFHDSALCARYGSQGTSGGVPATTLENILWGYLCFYPANTLAHWRSCEDDFKRTLSVDQWHARIGKDKMVNHRFLSDDFQVEQTEFSSGVSAIVNFGDDECCVEGKRIGGRSYWIG
jgi:hypothetical protein